MTLVLHENNNPNARWPRIFKYDPDRTITSPDGTLAAIFTAPHWAKKPKKLRIMIVNPGTFEAVGYITFSNQRHNFYVTGYNAPDYVSARIRDMTETGVDLANRLFAILGALKK